MRRTASVLFLAGLLACTTMAFAAPLPWAAALLFLGATAATTKSRKALMLLGASSLIVNLLLFGLFGAGPTTTLGLHPQGLAMGAAAALRLTAVAAVSLGGLTLVPIEPLLDGLRLPRRATATLAALALCARDVARDAQRMSDAARLEGSWPRRGLARVRAGASLLPPLLVVSVRRAETRREALRLAGMDLAPGWTPLVAVSALAIAGRFALLAVPNVAFTYVLVFLGGVLFGPRLGALAGLLSMAASDLAISGLQPVPFVNAPAMALLGLMGGALRHLDWSSTRRSQAWANGMLAAALGVVATLLFSVASDALSWALVPDYRSQPGALGILVAAGLVFNVVPAAINGVLFAVATPAAVRAWRAAGEVAPRGLVRPGVSVAPPVPALRQGPG